MLLPKTKNCIAMKPRRCSAYKPSLLLLGFFLNILKTKPICAKWFYVIHIWILFYIFFLSFSYFDKLLVFIRNKLWKKLSTMALHAKKLGNSNKMFAVNKRLYSVVSILQQLLTLAMCFFLVDCMHTSAWQAGWFTLLAGKPSFSSAVHYLCVPK